MNSRRIPFQFSSTDPVARQKELEKRFGSQHTGPKMYVDVNCPSSMGNIPKETSSPRLQHRVPIFAEGYDHPVHSSSVDSMASVPDKKPNVRVIPIEIEGADSKPQRLRTYSGPAGTVKDDNLASERNGSPFKRLHVEDLSRSSRPKSNIEPKVYNIPIKVEGADNISTSSKVVASNNRSATPSGNGCSLSKSSCKIESSKIDDKVKLESNAKQTDQSKNIEILLKKIEDVLVEFKTYESGVLDFNGTSKDKQYRYLDEMLTRCMLRLDDIDTMGNEQVRLSRKNAVRKIQASIDLLESKANVESVEVLKVQTAGENNIVDKNNSIDIEMQNNQVNDNKVALSENDSSSSEIKEIDLYVDDNKDLNEVSERVVENNGENSSMVGSIKMSEVIQDKMTSSEVENDHMMLSQENLNLSLEQQQDNMPESEMPKETSLINIKSDMNTSKEASEVEMAEIKDISSKESDEKLECETSEKAVHKNFNCSKQETDSNIVHISESDVAIVCPKDAEMEDVQSTLGDMGQGNIKHASQQCEKADSQMVEPKQL